MSVVKHQNCMLLHVHKGKVTVTLGIQVFNTEVLSVKNRKYKATQTLSAAKLHYKAEKIVQATMGESVALI